MEITGHEVQAIGWMLNTSQLKSCNKYVNHRAMCGQALSCSKTTPAKTSCATCSEWPVTISAVNQSIINHSVLSKSRSFTANTAFSTLPSSQSFFLYLHTVHLPLCCLSSDIFFCREFSSCLSFLLEHPSAGSYFLVSGPANFYSSSLSVLALFFLLALFLAQLHFFILSVHLILVR